LEHWALAPVVLAREVKVIYLEGGRMNFPPRVARAQCDDLSVAARASRQGALRDGVVFE